MFHSSNQRAQQDGDTGKNEVVRMKLRESEIKSAWRTYYYHNECYPSAQTLAALTEYPEHFVAMICERIGYQLTEE
jgi:hypothetical protein